VRLFRRFHVLCFARRSSTHIGSYYFQHYTKGPSKYIATLSPAKWDRLREDWVIAHGDAHDQLELPTPTPTTHCSDWEKDPNLQPAYNTLLDRIYFLVEKGLTSMMVLHNYLSKCIAPL
jgi:hypothetical protein